jgi:hypothetical protein
MKGEGHLTLVGTSYLECFLGNTFGGLVEEDGNCCFRTPGFGNPANGANELPQRDLSRTPHDNSTFFPFAVMKWMVLASSVARDGSNAVALRLAR